MNSVCRQTFLTVSAIRCYKICLLCPNYIILIHTGVDFHNESFTIEVPAETTIVRITNITVVNDNVNEREEVFALVARILGQAADVACFQLNENNPCNSEGHIGGTQLIIRDNDRKYTCIHKSNHTHDVLSKLCLQACILDFLNGHQQ